MGSWTRSTRFEHADHQPCRATPAGLHSDAAADPYRPVRPTAVRPRRHGRCPFGADGRRRRGHRA